ncbi:MAG: XdhC/CoxI family protein [Candidatus Riflebacteria bacterium]|nr:XdhC/CoxI family protein [Candidatus Riflebacteria bacterium]
MATEFFQELRRAFNKNEPFVLCTVVETIGSSPGTVGQKMIVFRDGSISGSVGGGINEERVREAAIDQFKNGTSTIMTFDLSNPLVGNDPICGGKARVFIELQAHEPRMVVFGAGHIGKILAKMAALARFRVTIIDERSEFANPAIFPECERVICKSYEEAVVEAALDENCHVVVVTPGHLKDFEVLEKVIPTKASYIGLVSSAKKLIEMKRALVAQGIAEKRTEELFAPIGINLGSTTPEEIAVEILAQIVAFRNGKIIGFQK